MHSVLRNKGVVESERFILKLLKKKKRYRKNLNGFNGYSEIEESCCFRGGGEEAWELDSDDSIQCSL